MNNKKEFLNFIIDLIDIISIDLDYSTEPIFELFELMNKEPAEELEKYLKFKDFFED